MPLGPGEVGGNLAAPPQGRAFQCAVDCVEHVVLFHGGGASGVGGCARGFVVMDEQVDVLAHHRAVLPGTGWRVKDGAVVGP